ncbi:MAG TPA: AAA family ATPase [Rhizomicrobium sp.]
MANSVLILTGPPGAGKSTVAGILARGSTAPAVHLHSDDFYDRYIKSGFVLPWLREAQAQNEVVVTAIAAAAAAYAAGGYFTIVDGIVLPMFLAPYRAAARAQEIALDYAVLRPMSAEISLARVQHRNEHGLKAEGPIRDLYAQFAALGALESHVFDSGRGSAAEIAAALAPRIRAGEFRLA